MDSGLQAYRASILHFTGEPTARGEGVEFFEDGLLVVENGRIKALDHAQILLPKLSEWSPSTAVVDLTGQFILPGFIDSHIHFPQLDIIGSYGEQLLDWLNNYTFPAELRFANADYAAQVAARFLTELLSAGTTTAMVYCTVHSESVEAFFSESQSRGTGMLAGKVLMDRNAPPALTDSAISGYEQSQALIDRWHNNGRQKYVVTPRFAPTSTAAQLQAAGKLLRENSGVYMQTHLSENLAEIEWVKSLFPERKHYLDVYEHYGLVGETCVFGHGIHLSEDEWQRLAATGSGIAFCPTSNLFLGSGLFDLATAKAHGVSVSLATDVGAGTNLCQLVSLNEAYKVSQLRGYPLHPYEGFYWLTLGNAKALQLESEIGNFAAGKYADFVVLDGSQIPVVDYRLSLCNELWEKLFLFMTLGDDRLIAQTYVAGQRC